MLRSLLLPAVLAGALAACVRDAGTEGPGGTGLARGEGALGSARISVTVRPVGAFRKAAILELDRLLLTLSAPGQDTLRDTLALTGSGLQTQNRAYAGLSSEVAWKLDARVFDAHGVVVHADTAGFTVPAGAARDVRMELSARYSMLTARFFPIRDSVTRVEVWVGDSLRGQASFAKQSRVGDTVAVEWDYLPASPSGTRSPLRLDVYGDFWGEANVLLYRGIDTLSAVSGRDSTHRLALKWVHPIPPPQDLGKMGGSFEADGPPL